MKIALFSLLIASSLLSYTNALLGGILGQCNFVNCFVDPCVGAAYNGCPSYPNAVCKANYCNGCNYEWLVNGQKVNCYDKHLIKRALFQCQNIVNCFVRPCQFASCAAYPNAVCYDNYCGGCFADFYVNGVKVQC